MVRGKLWTLLLAGLLLAACSGGHANPDRPGSSAAPAEASEQPPAGFYTLPRPLPAGGPGALICSVVIAGSPQVPGSRAWAVLYHSRSLGGGDVAVSGIVLAPPGAAPAGGWPVLTWGTARPGWPTAAPPPASAQPAPSDPPAACGSASCWSTAW